MPGRVVVPAGRDGPPAAPQRFQDVVALDERRERLGHAVQERDRRGDNRVPLLSVAQQVVSPDHAAAPR